MRSFLLFFVLVMESRCFMPKPSLPVSRAAVPLSKSYSMNNKGENNTDNAEYDDSANGILLSAEAYLDTSLMEAADSTSKLPATIRIQNRLYQTAVEGLFSPPPSYYIVDDNNTIDNSNQLPTKRGWTDEEMLLQALQEIRSRNDTTTQANKDADILYQQVFAEEQAHLQQSLEFRQSLSSSLLNNASNTDDVLDKKRREEMERRNEQFLQDLMKEIDEMERNAVSREEAIRRMESYTVKENEQDWNNNILLEESTNLNSVPPDLTTRNVFCRKCGFRVTPDMIERVEQLRKEMEPADSSKREIPSQMSPKYREKILCQACYGSQFRAATEAEIRHGSSSFYYSSTNEESPLNLREKGGRNSIIQSWTNESEERRKKVSITEDNENASVPSIGMSQDPNTKKNKNYSSFQFESAAEASAFTNYKSTHSKDWNGSSRELRGMELAKRKFQQQSSDYSSNQLNKRPMAINIDRHSPTENLTHQTLSSDLSSDSALLWQEEQSRPDSRSEDLQDTKRTDRTFQAMSIKANFQSNKDSNGAAVFSHEHSKKAEKWVKVTDKNRVFYWNKSTGEMRRNAPMNEQ